MQAKNPLYATLFWLERLRRSVASSIDLFQYEYFVLLLGEEKILNL